jgi:hypothetical protein
MKAEGGRVKTSGESSRALVLQQPPNMMRQPLAHHELLLITQRQHPPVASHRDHLPDMTGIHDRIPMHSLKIRRRQMVLAVTRCDAQRSSRNRRPNSPLPGRSEFCDDIDHVDEQGLAGTASRLDPWLAQVIGWTG